MDAGLNKFHPSVSISPARPAAFATSMPLPRPRLEKIRYVEVTKRPFNYLRIHDKHFRPCENSRDARLEPLIGDAVVVNAPIQEEDSKAAAGSRLIEVPYRAEHGHLNSPKVGHLIVPKLGLLSPPLTPFSSCVRNRVLQFQARFFHDSNVRDVHVQVRHIADGFR